MLIHEKGSGIEPFSKTYLLPPSACAATSLKEGGNTMGQPKGSLPEGAVGETD